MTYEMRRHGRKRAEDKEVANINLFDADVAY